MEAILITTIDTIFQIDTITSIRFVNDKEELFYTEGDSFLNISLSNDVVNDYDPSQIELIKNKLDFPNYYYVDFNSFKLFKEFIEGLDLENYLIDNDRDILYDKKNILKIKSAEEFYTWG